MPIDIANPEINRCIILIVSLLEKVVIFFSAKTVSIPNINANKV